METPLFLDTRTHFSLLRGVSKIKDFVSCAKERGCHALGIADIVNFYGVTSFYKECEKQEMRPILGATFYLQEIQDVHPKILLFAKNKDGYRSLMRLITTSQFNRSVKTNRPVLTSEMIKREIGNIVAIAPPATSSINLALRKENETEAKKHLDLCKELFGNDFFMGITHQEIPEYVNYKETLLKLAKDAHVPCIPLPLIYYLEPEDTNVRDVLIRIQPSIRPNEEEDIFPVDLSMPTKEVYEKEYSKEMRENLKNLSEKLKVKLEFGNWVFPTPSEELKNDEDKQKFLKEKIEKGLKSRKLTKTKEIENRIEEELKVIFDKNYTDYFIVVIDIIEHMHNVGILTTTRGSASGSFVAYLTKITSVDPMEMNIPFERFLNPFRPSAPDIDVDIADDRRTEVISYITNRFGKEKVAQIGTFGTMLARAAVRDTARALGHSYTTGDRIAKLIPFGKQGMPVYMDDALKEVKELADLYENEKDIKTIIDTAKKIEGNARHISVHAAGVVIAPQALTDYMSLEPEQRGGNAITQFDMHAVEDAGPLKFDFLGLSNLSILANTLKKIEDAHGKEIDIDMLPLDDEKTFAMLNRCLTKGVFQLGGTGITEALRQVEPQNLYDIAAIIALYRPGPMKNIKEYAERKKGLKPIQYLHPKMKEYLDKSYGVLVYQDDLLFTAIELANYDWEEVDVFRKAVGKKIPKLMAAQEIIFKQRVVQHSGATKQQAQEIWDLFDPFKGYGFNKAHAISYAKVAYQTAYLKANYPAEYMASVITASKNDKDEIAEYVYETRQLEIKILPPDVRFSEMDVTVDYTSEKPALRMGLHGIKNVSENAVENIINARQKAKGFSSLSDFLYLVGENGGIERKSLESLIQSGALDSFGERNTLLKNLSALLSYCKEVSSASKEQDSLFVTPNKPSELSLLKEEPVDALQKYAWEKELLGVYITGHPLLHFQSKGLSLAEVKEFSEGRHVCVLGILDNIKVHRTAQGKKMCFVVIEDECNTRIEGVCFPNTAEEYADLLIEHRPTRIYGETSMRNGEITLKIDKIENP